MTRRPSPPPPICLLAFCCGLAASAGDPSGDVLFVDAAREAGVLAVNVSGSSEKRHIVETTGAGACFLDHDLDGDVDLYLVNGATLARRGRENPAHNVLLRNDGGRFADVTEAAGVGDRGWGGGCTVGDYDGDGDPDLYVTNHGTNVLYRNLGDGSFADATREAGVGGADWSAGATFFDADGDGDLDLYVTNYLEFDLDSASEMATGCRWKGAPVMCGPHGFTGRRDLFYSNQGDGRFREATAESGLAAAPLFGLGVVAGDLDGDGDTDLYVANDSQLNLLFVNDGTGRFQERGLLAGLALSGDGREQAGMGVDLGDFDEDGDADVFVTNFSDDYHTLYRNDGGGLFTDVSIPAGLAGTRSSLGWGGGFLDFDNDGDLDLFVAGGHVYPQVDDHDPTTSYRQRNLLYRNDGGRFADVTAQAGPGLALVQASRGAAFGDYDDDGDLDIVVINENDRPALLRNDGGNSGRWLKISLRGSAGNRDGIGARVSLTAGGRTQVREQRLSAGYASSHDPRMHFGLGQAQSVERVEVHWPSGKIETLEMLPANRLAVIDETRGLVELRPLGGAGRPVDAPNRPQSAPLTATAAAAPGAAGRTDALTGEELRRIDRLVVEGTQSIMAGRHAAGIEAYRSALDRLPTWEQARQSPDALGFGDREEYRRFLAGLYDNLGVGLMRSERLDECAAPIVRAIEIDPQRPKFHHNLGLCHFHGGRYDAAAAALGVARAAADARPTVHYDLGRTLALAGRCVEAEPELELAIERLPRPELRGRRAESWYHLGSCRIEQGRFTEAAAALRESLALVPGHQKALYRLALALQRAGEPEAARRALELFAARQEADEAARAARLAGVERPGERVALARAYLAARLPPQALREVRAVLAAAPQHAEALRLLGTIALDFRPPRLEMARDAFERALAGERHDVDALTGLAETHRRSGDTAEAERHFREALNVDPTDAAARIGLARLATQAGRVEEGVARLRVLLRGQPDQRDAILALAEILVVDRGDRAGAEEALRLLDTVAARYGEDTELRFRALIALGRRDEADRLIAGEPFLGRAERERLRRVAG